MIIFSEILEVYIYSIFMWNLIMLTFIFYTNVVIVF